MHYSKFKSQKKSKSYAADIILWEHHIVVYQGKEKYQYHQNKGQNSVLTERTL